MNNLGLLKPRLAAISNLRFMTQLGDLGSGAGKGGGGGGSIRQAGGAFGKAEAAHEEEYFYKKQRKQLAKLKEDLHDEIHFHEEQIKRHQEAINRHKQRVQDIEKK
ncbi:ATPase inhibitor mai-2, mitochondrial-like [Onthophagus taurus]|uniref:ATPase inhibitor mai-2, mitochondrial-like n=1 Tax=Onthophagus taurus TaxID=166361 RepID=UPI000C201B0A|nr:ATPase inhibitor mai-2, mitochondrial-like [Onthophagus taurus]